MIASITITNHNAADITADIATIDANNANDASLWAANLTVISLGETTF